MTLEETVLKEMTAKMREPDACSKCHARMAADNPGGVDIKKKFPSHLKAICWAYLCDDCAAIVAAAVR